MIVSKNNETIKLLRKNMQEQSIVFLDTKNVIEEALRASWDVQVVVCLPTADISYLDGIECERVIVSEEVLKHLTNVESTTGIAVGVAMKKRMLAKPSTSFVVLDNVQDPGNVGTIIRSALGSNFKTVILVNCASVQSPKVIRSSSGAVFHCEIYEIKEIGELLQIIPPWNIELIAADMYGEDLFSCSLPNQFGLVLGNEGHGISKEIKNICNRVVSIPMQNGLESLNVGVAGSIIMFTKQFGGK